MHRGISAYRRRTTQSGKYRSHKWSRRASTVVIGAFVGGSILFSSFGIFADEIDDRKRDIHLLAVELDILNQQIERFQQAKKEIDEQSQDDYDDKTVMNQPTLNSLNELDKAIVQIEEDMTKFTQYAQTLKEKNRTTIHSYERSIVDKQAKLAKQEENSEKNLNNFTNTAYVAHVFGGLCIGVVIGTLVNLKFH
eukprot:TRINITY_DN973_c0_g1_i1.p1 TRINITY_DN973_c0_g1~~TRINITY_DN973_c0_g1_i1.p1  ORF type:complete len:194 (+),score=44.72 TRINITY_DN973_c0_g1_i1:36-617(+)